ncbi:MAG: class I SAM-dependent methyltransferase [Betaproteobacteria bacterium]|uniref:class I SAM-dependent rRNA methyltransferase n=1 Tax=Thiomonas sp. FB-6 TaxID=1158291 RepID=UPI000372E084|nr:class I SAM-dependent methyltransferase [Thiomonas sp. FB-6]MBU6439450.1 class I SAM-dependent methyltransferase [Betaproteobacteria bacterium]MBU6512018.1 class I SAM-dependent methyltransferase [Betaproteobacteria bacterium]MDE1955982.1 class I SAM-dependent methyltransferase [Betaproteobacteria bacterium]MDE2151449.1 class I SAM-dependent methyltransferase [Betaproteobacteria bacterium]MDE2478905.1 class I SAM-dependent methyltransferase [Betaproteobacteria bacterium]
MKVIRLHPGKERAVLRRHPWIFAGAIARGGADSGETVRVESHEGQLLGWAAYSPASQIRLRMWSFDPAQRIDRDFLHERLRASIARRHDLGIDLRAARLVWGEADGLPGFVVDRYADVAVVQLLSAGAERWRETLLQALRDELPGLRIHERSDVGVREREGLPERSGWLHGDGSSRVDIEEHGMRLHVDVAGGHKTGFYLDQRDNRLRFRELVRQRGLRRVLNCYGYTGGFTLAALAGGAEEVITVDSSGPALELAAEHLRGNGFDPARNPLRQADVGRVLRELREAGERFDAIVLDPPKLAPTVAQAPRATRAYKDINRLALGLLRPGGWLFSFSCSGGIDAPLFQSVVAGAAVDAGRDADIVQRVGAAPDHPLLLSFPEGEYLKGLLLRAR